MRLYGELAPFYPLLTPPEDYVAEARWLDARLPPGGSLLELGCGPGHLAHWLTGRERVLTDLSPDMLALARALNPDCRIAQGDMCSLRLDERFDAVLVHDAVCYLLAEEQLAAMVATARAHLRPGGQLWVMPDFVAETFAEGTERGEASAPDGRRLRWIEHTVAHPTDPGRYEARYAFLATWPDGREVAAQDVHVEGLFPRETWTRVIEAGGFTVEVIRDDWDRDVFFGVLSG